jgi:hypothetical protein
MSGAFEAEAQRGSPKFLLPIFRIPDDWHLVTRCHFGFAVPSLTADITAKNGQYLGQYDRSDSKGVSVDNGFSATLVSKREKVTVLRKVCGTPGRARWRTEKGHDG